MNVKRIVHWGAMAMAALLLIAVLAAGYLLLLHGRAPAQRPDLVRLPPGAPETPPGYPTTNAMILAFLLGRIDILDIEAPIPVPPGVIEERDIEYGRAGDTALLLDLYAPKEAKGRMPGLIFIHGGGWEQGHRKDYKYYTTRFAERGYVVATISYRFAQAARFPGCVADAKCAVRWMRANAEKRHIDPDKIAVIGGSAGGYLALMTGYSSDVAKLEGKSGHAGFSSKPNAVVDLYGPVDLRTPYARDAREVTNFLPRTYAEDPALYDLASPLHHLDAKDPPTLVLQGTLDDLVPVHQSDWLVEKLQALGVHHYYARLDGWPHTMDITPEVNEYVQWLIQAFLEEVLRLRPGSVDPNPAQASADKPSSRTRHLPASLSLVPLVS